MATTRWSMLFVMVCASCASPRTHRTGQPLALPSDPPRSPCEERQWVQLAPTHVGAEAAETVAAGSTWILYSQHDESADGLAGYQNNLQLRLSAEQVAQLIANPQLRPDIDAQARAIRSRRSTTNGFVIGGLVATGVGGALALSNLEEPTAGLVIMGLGLTAEIIALLIRPHNADVAWAEVRERIFVDGETDMAALHDGVDALNQRTRASCGH